MKQRLACLAAALLAVTLHAKVVELELTIAETPVNFTGRTVQAMTINGGIPGPTLRFTEGDTARITVRNALREDTAIHWHGLLVPNAMDGVPHVNMAPHQAGRRFPLRIPAAAGGHVLVSLAQRPPGTARRVWGHRHRAPRRGESAR